MPDWLPDEPPAPRGLVGVALVPEEFPLPPTPIASTPVAPEPVPVEPEDEFLSPVVPLAPAEFEPVTVARVLAPVMELPTLDPPVVRPIAPEMPEVDSEVSEEPDVDRDILDPLESELLESPFWLVWVLADAVLRVLPPVAVGVGKLAVDLLVELEPVLIAVVPAVVVVTVDCVVLLAVVVTSAQKLSHWENDGSSVFEYTSDGVDAQ